MEPCPPTQEEVLESIRRAAHYRVVMRPSSFNAQRVERLSDLWQLVGNSKVSLRGWDYPHVSHRPEERAQGSEWIGAWCPWVHISEHWRLFQSGQFVHRFTFREDNEPFAERLRNSVSRLIPPHSHVSGFISITSTIWTLTEVHEFASRLAAKGLLDTGLELQIDMHGVRDRVLAFSEWERDVHALHKAHEDTLSYHASHTVDQLLSSARLLGRNASEHFFERFGASFPGSVLDDIQQGLYEIRT